MRKHYRGLMVAVLCLLLALLMIPVVGAAAADEGTTPEKGYFLTIYNADGTVGYTIDGTKSISDFCMKSAIADARVFVDNASLFGIKTPATYVIEMYEDSHENASFELGADVTINGNGHSIVLAEGVTLTNNATLNNVTIVDPSAPAVTVVTTGAELVDALENGGNVKLGADIALTAADDNDEDDYFVYIALYNDVTLDLNGYTLSCAVNPDWDDEYYYVVIFGGGHIVITDSVGTGKISARDQQISFEKSYANGAWTAAPTVTVEGGTIDSIALGEGGATFGTTGGNVTLYLYDLDYFYSEEEYDDYVKSLTFTSDPTAYCPEGYVVVDNGDGTYGFAEPYVAKIGNVGYETLEAAIAAAKDGDTVTLLANVAVANNNAYGIMISKAITIDGNGYTITVADGYSNSYALFYLYAVSGTVTVKNLTFDGVKSGAAIWAHDADLVVENCVFQNGTHTQIQGIVRTTCADLTVKNSKFLNNTCNFVITFNFDAAESDTMVVEGCEFIGNTVTDTAVIYYVAGASATIKDNLFEDNKITSAAAAVIYLSSTATVTGNAFLSNEVTGTGAAGDKCGVIATGSSAAGSVINGNAFAGNTVATTGANVVATVWVGSNNVNLSGNYWGGNEPEKGAAKDVYLAKSGLILDSYYTTYENGVLGGYTEILTYVAKVGNTYYTSLQDAIDAAAALTANNAVILIADCTADVVVSSGYFSIYFNGYTLTGTIKQVGGILTLTDSGKIKNTGLDGKYPIYHADGQMNIVGSFTVEATGENGVAFYVAGNKVNVDGNITVNGAVQTAPQGIMNISKGIFNGALIQATNSSLSVSGGSYKLDPASLLKGGFIATQEGGYYVVTAKPFSLDDLDVDTDGAYLIKTPEELISFRELAGTGGKASLSGKVFKLANNIDLAGYVLGPCCDDNNRFAGTFDGQGYKILNMVIEATGTTEVGFFGSTSGATIKNVIFENVTVTGAERVAAIVGRSRATTIENCKVTGTISITGSSGNVGAILGLGVATITDCTVSGTGTIEGAWGVGGIVGGLSAGSAEASNNTVEGITIKAKSGYAGGIAGRALNSAGATQVLANNLVKNVTIIVEEDTYVSSLIVGMTQTAATVTLDKNIAEGSTLTVAGVAKTNLDDAACEASENVTIIAPVSYVAKVGETYFVTLQDAIDAAVKNGGTVVLLSDVVLEAPLYIPAEKTLIIDGAGYKLTPAAGFTTNDHNAVIVLANGDRGYSANSNYTIKNLTFEGFTGISRVIRANFANVLIENCEFYGNTVRGGVITASFAELTVIGCTFDGNTVAGDAAYGVIDIGSDVGAGTTVVANIKNNKFTNNSVQYAVLFLFSSANVEGNYFASNVHIGSNPNAAAILAGPYTGRMAYTIKVTGNAFVNALGNLPAVYAEDWSSLGCTTAFDLSNNYWNGVKPVAGVAYATNVEAPTLVMSGYYTTYENGVLGGLTAIKKPQGNVAYRGYITDTDSREAIQLDLENVFAENSFVIKYYDANGNLLITTTYKYGGVDAANFTCNTVLWGSPSGSWNTEIHATLTTANVPAKVEIYADGILVDSYQHASGSVLADKLDAYLALDSVIKPTDSLLKIEHTSIVLNESFKFRFAFPASFFTDGIAGHYVVIDKVSAHDGSVKSVTLDTSSWYYIYIGSEKYYVVEFAGVTSKEMMDQLQVTVYGPDGNPVSETKHDSIHDYAERMFATSNDVTLKALLVDILNYGAEAQTYFGYATANLANKDLTDELKALATGARAYSGEMHSKTFAEGYSFTAANRLLLDNNIRLQAAFDLRALTLSENAKIRLSYVSSTGTSYVTEYAVADYDYKGDYIIISCDTLTPLDQNVKVSFEVIDGATTILTLTDSVEAYVARMGTGSLEAVCTALMQYCDSVKVYQSTLK